MGALEILRQEWTEDFGAEEAAALLDGLTEEGVRGWVSPPVTLDPADLENLDAAEQFSSPPTHLTAEDFDPDQPRDEAGRWTDAGGGAPPSARTPSGMRRGTEAQAATFAQGSAIAGPLYHGTRAPEQVRAEGIRAGVDELTDVPGISLATTAAYAGEYSTEGTGTVFEFRALIRKPITQADLEIQSGETQDVTAMHRWAKAHGYDAVVGPQEVRVFSPRQLFLVEHSADQFESPPTRLSAALFDPDQPRDERGRWTDTGGGGGTATAEPPAVQPGVGADPTGVEEQSPRETAWAPTPRSAGERRRGESAREQAVVRAVEELDLLPPYRALSRDEPGARESPERPLEGWLHTPLKRAPLNEREMLDKARAEIRAHAPGKKAWGDGGLANLQIAVPLSMITTPQPSVLKTAVRKFLDRAPVAPIHLVKIDNTLILQDGNHRTVTSFLIGRQTIPAYVLDLDELQNRPQRVVHEEPLGPEDPMYLEPWPESPKPPPGADAWPDAETPLAVPPDAPQHRRKGRAS